MNDIPCHVADAQDKLIQIDKPGSVCAWLIMIINIMIISRKHDHEHPVQLFLLLVLLQMYGVDWDTLAKEIPTKEKTQIKNYYQNYKQRLELDQIELPHTAKHPKPSRGPSRASTPRPGGLCTTHFLLGVLRGFWDNHPLFASYI